MSCSAGSSNLSFLVNLNSEKTVEIQKSPPATFVPGSCEPDLIDKQSKCIFAFHSCFSYPAGRGVYSFKCCCISFVVEYKLMVIG